VTLFLLLEEVVLLFIQLLLCDACCCSTLCYCCSFVVLLWCACYGCSCCYCCWCRCWYGTLLLLIRCCWWHCCCDVLTLSVDRWYVMMVFVMLDLMLLPLFCYYVFCCYYCCDIVVVVTGIVTLFIVIVVTDCTIVVLLFLLLYLLMDSGNFTLLFTVVPDVTMKFYWLCWLNDIVVVIQWLLRFYRMRVWRYRCSWEVCCVIPLLDVLKWCGTRWYIPLLLFYLWECALKHTFVIPLLLLLLRYSLWVMISCSIRWIVQFWYCCDSVAYGEAVDLLLMTVIC